MKKTVLILLLLNAIFYGGNIYASESAESQSRDSIFRIAASQPNDTLRSRFLRGVFEQQISQSSAMEYLDSAYALSKRKQLHEEELWILFDYCRRYEFCADIDNMEKHLQMLRDASYRYKIYTYYYTAWMAALQMRCVQGDTEYAILQAKKMREEALGIKNQNGIFIASLALGQAYYFANQNNDAIEVYEQALKENPDANDNALLSIYSKLADLYKKEKMYPQALHKLQQRLDVMNKKSKGAPLSDTYKAIFLGIETSFCTIYMETGNKEKMKQHLERARKYYDKNSFFAAGMDYHALWGEYYRLNKEWSNSLKEFDLALSAQRETVPLRTNGILKMKAKVLLESGRYKEAAEIYKIAAQKSDSINQDIMFRHEETYDANYRIQNAPLEKEELKEGYRRTQVIVAAAILTLLIFVTIRTAHLRKLLRRSEKQTREAFEIVKAADKIKERFLHNITFEIRIPLNTVVGFSELLSSENELQESEIEEYSAAIKKNSVKLLALINNILDLSRLEAGMMRFNVQECDIVQLCREAKMMTNMQFPQIVDLTFHTDLKELMVQADSEWFLKLLTTLFAVPGDYKGEACKVEYTLSKAGKFLKINVKGSPLYLCWENEQEQRILHDINRLYVETFKGSYQILGKEKEKLVSITYPIA
ncbi:MAG: hypothetical protein LUE99_14565 [Bacteroides sp.]|nr:hypothetical protein [Bacteroides sp.]